VSSIVTYVCYLLCIFISPPIYYYALCLLKPPLDQSGYASCYRRYRLDITLWYNRVLWLCTLCLCVQTYTISYPIHDHYYCMFYYVSMRLISTSINQWLFRFCLASLRSCYRNDFLYLLRTRRYPHGCVKPLAVEAISYVSISYHVKDCIYILGTSASIFSTLRELRLVLLLYCSNHYEQDDMAWVEKLVRYKSYLYLVSMSNDCIE